MSTDEIRTLLHESTEKINDEDFLLLVKEIIDNKYKSPSYPLLSDWQKQRIKESEKQIEEGNFLTKDEADKLVDEWLRKIIWSAHAEAI